jgi:hypothetical protein
MRCILQVTYTGGDWEQFRMGDDPGEARIWNIEMRNGIAMLVVGRGVPRVEIPLSSVRKWELLEPPPTVVDPPPYVDDLAWSVPRSQQCRRVKPGDASRGCYLRAGHEGWHTDGRGTWRSAGDTCGNVWQVTDAGGGVRLVCTRIPGHKDSHANDEGAVWG